MEYRFGAADLTKEGLYSRKQWDRSGAIRDQDLVKGRIAELRAEGSPTKRSEAAHALKKLTPDIRVAVASPDRETVGIGGFLLIKTKAMELAVGFVARTYPTCGKLRKLKRRCADSLPKRGGTMASPTSERTSTCFAQIPGHVG